MTPSIHKNPLKKATKEISKTFGRAIKRLGEEKKPRLVECSGCRRAYYKDLSDEVFETSCICPFCEEEHQLIFAPAPPKEEDWEERFDKEFEVGLITHFHSQRATEEVKSFIRTLLKEQKDAIMKEYANKNKV